MPSILNSRSPIREYSPKLGRWCQRNTADPSPIASADASSNLARPIVQIPKTEKPRLRVGRAGTEMFSCSSYPCGTNHATILVHKSNPDVLLHPKRVDAQIAMG